MVKEIDYKRYLKYLPGAFLIVVLVAQTVPYLVLFNFFQGELIKKSLIDLWENPKIYLTPLNGEYNGYNLFAQRIYDAIPENAKVTFVYDKKDYEDWKYYVIRFFLRPNMSATYHILDNAEITSKKEIIDFMNNDKSNYILIYNRPDLVELVTGRKNSNNVIMKLNGENLERVGFYD